MASTSSISRADWRVILLASLGGALEFYDFVVYSLFARIRRTASASAVPIAELVRTHSRAVLVGVGILAVTAGFNGLLFAMPAFLPQTMGYEAARASEAQTVALAIMSAGLLLVAWLSDRVPRKPLALVGTALLVVLAWPFFAAAQSRSIDLLVLFALGGVVGSICAGTVIAISADLFPTLHPFLGRGAVLQPGLHAVQWARARDRRAARAKYRSRGNGRVLHDRLRGAVVRRSARHAPLRRANPRGRRRSPNVTPRFLTARIRTR